MKIKKKQQQQQTAEAHSPTKQTSRSSTPTSGHATITRPSTPAKQTPPTPTVNLSSVEKINFDNRIKRKNVLALNEKVAAIREYDKMPVYKHVGRIFNCSPDQIKRIVQQRENILQAWEQRTRRSQDAKTLEMKVVRVSMLGKAVFDWIRRMMYYKDFMITDGLIQKMALQFKSAMGLLSFFPHQEWCDKFRLTYNITHNDTKLLNFGYTQGYSVQIKDIMKDVLTECTPETAAKTREDRQHQSQQQKQKQASRNHIKYNEANDEDDDADIDAIADDDDDDGDNDECDDDDDADSRILDSDAEFDESTADGDSNNANDEYVATRASNDTDSESKDVDVDGIDTTEQDIKPALGINVKPHATNICLPQLQGRVLPPLQPIHQLLALPFKTNAPPGTTQKVLVATPITTPGQLRKEGTQPMTMTIIPLATLAQSVQQQQQNQQLQQQKQYVAIKPQQTVPAPMIDIKKEIKEEPKDDVNDEQSLETEREIMSEIQPEPATVSTINAALLTTMSVPVTAALALKKPELAPICIKQEIVSDNEDNDEYDAAADINERLTMPTISTPPKLSNIVNILASLESSKVFAAHDMKNQNVVAEATTAASVGMPPMSSAAETTTAVAVTGKIQTITKDLLANSRRAMSTRSITKASSIVPSKQLLPIARKTSYAKKRVAATVSTASKRNPSNKKRKMNQRVQQQQHNNNNNNNKKNNNNNDVVNNNNNNNNNNSSEKLNAIQSCAEARKYLKLLEEFALRKENYRLIALITRADEVLREKDEDRDQDVGID